MLVLKSRLPDVDVARLSLRKNAAAAEIALADSIIGQLVLYDLLCEPGLIIVEPRRVRYIEIRKSELFFRLL